MKNKIKKLAAFTFSALGVLVFSSEVFCQCSSVKCSGHMESSSKKSESVTNSDKVLLNEYHVAYIGEKDPVNEFYGGVKKLVYPIGTFDVKRFYKVIELNKINSSWNCYISDNNETNPIYGFCIMFAKNDKSVYFFFNPMELPEKFVGPNWDKEGFSLEALLNNFKKFVLSFGFKERKFYRKNIKDSTIFEVPSEITCLSDKTFENFSNLEKIVIPSTVKKISNGAFKGCKKLKIIQYMGTNYFSVQEFMDAFNYLMEVLENVDKETRVSYEKDFN